MKALNLQFDLFNTTPYLNYLKRVSLYKFVFMVVVVTWLPLIFLSSYDSKNLLWDITTCVRFLFVLPLLMLSPYIIREKLLKLVNHFLDSHLVQDSQRDRFLSYVQSTLRLRDMAGAKVFMWLVIYAGAFSISRQVIHSSTAADTWFKFVSQPIYLFVQFYFIYRGVLWWRFLFLVSRLDLHLKASHGDEAGGLAFLGGSIRIFCLPILTLSSSVAVRALHFIMYEGGSINELKVIVGLLIAFFFLLFISPLFLFSNQMVREKVRASYKYGKLAHYQLHQFEQKWLSTNTSNKDQSLLDAPDFSTIADASAVVNNAYHMKVIPFQPKALIAFILSIVLPFLPVVAIKIPWIDILKKLFNFII